MTRRRRRFLIVIGVLGMVALMVWALHDRPRLVLARVLGARLGATVTIRQLEIVATDHVRLRGVTVREMASQPRLAQLTLDVVDAEGPPRALASGQLSALRAHGGLLVLQTPKEPAAPRSETLPRIDRLTLTDVEIQLPNASDPGRAGRPPERIRVDGTLVGLGGHDLTGEARLRVPAIDTSSLFALAGLDPAVVVAGRETNPTSLPGASLLDLALRTTAGQTHLVLDATLPHVRMARAEVIRDAEGVWTVVDGRVEGLSLGPWATAIPMTARPEVAGTLDITIADEPAAGVHWRATLDLEHAAWAPDAPADASAHLWRARDWTGSLSGVAHRDPEAGVWHTSFDSQLDGVVQPPEALVGRAHRSIPLRVSAHGQGQRDPVPTARGTATVRAASWGTVDLEGALDAEQLLIDIDGRGPLAPWTTLPSIQRLHLDTATGDWRLDGTIAGPWATAQANARIDVDTLRLRLADHRGLHAETFSIDLQAQPTSEGTWTPVSPSPIEVEARGVVITEDDVPRLRVGHLRLDSVRPEPVRPGLRTDRIRARGRAHFHDVDLPPWRDPNLPGVQADRATVAFDLDGARHDVTAILEGLRVDTPTGHWISGGPATVSTRGTLSDTHFTVASMPWTIVPTTGGPLAGPVALTIGGDARLDLAAREADRVHANIMADGLGHATITGRAGPRETELHFDLPAADLVPWLDHVPALRAMLPTGYALSGQATADLRLHAAEAQPWSVTGDVALLGGGLASDDGSRVLQGLPASATINLGPGRQSADGLTLEAVAHVGGFQMLWGAVFADYSAHAAVAEIDAHWRRSPTDGSGDTDPGDTAVDGRAAVGLRFGGAASAGAPTIDLTLATDPEQGFTYTLRAASDDAGSVLATDLLMPLQGSVPWLEALEVAGAATVELAGRWRDDVREARGRVRVERGLGAYADDRFRAEGLDLDLPVDLRWRRDATPQLTGPALEGRVRFARLIAGGLAFEPVATTLDIEADRVRFTGGLNGPFLGGRLGLGGLALVDLLRPTRHISTAIELRAVDLGLAAARLGLPPLEGRLDGAFPRVRANVARFEVEGDGAFDVFGGSVRVFDIAGSEIFSRYPRLTFSADFAEIDLEQVTRTFDFGVMTGHVEGQLRQCELFRGTPVRCTGRLTSMPERHTKRYIDIKAVNNISILGTGGRIGRLDRGLHRFLRRFTYDALGVDIVLREDRFRLRGLLQRDQRELFLRGRLPFPIDIVNVEPGNTVSFQTMLGRLRNFQIGGKP